MTRAVQSWIIASLAAGFLAACDSDMPDHGSTRTAKDSVVGTDSADQAVPTPVPTGLASAAPAQADGVIDKTVEIESRTGPEASKAKLTMTRFATAVPAKDDAPFIGSSPKGLTIIGPQDIRLLDAERLSGVGAWPTFFGSPDQMLMRLPVVTDDGRPAAWYFYDEAAVPAYEAAEPAYVFEESQNARPDLAALGWEMPPNKEAGIVFASERVLWVRLPDHLLRLHRSGNRWRLSKIPLSGTESGRTNATFTETTAYLVAATGETSGYIIEDDKITRMASRVPAELAAAKVIFLSMGEWEVALDDAKGFARKRSEGTWLPIEDAPKLKAATTRLSHGHGKKAWVVVGEEAFAFVLDDGVVVEEEALRGIPAAVLAIVGASCAGCHTVRATQLTYSGAGFDHLSIDHWQAFVLARGEVAAGDFIVNDMCARAGDSACKTDAGNQAALRTFIGEVLSGASGGTPPISE